VDEEAKTAEKYAVSGLPTSFFVDGKGKIREKHIGWLEEQQILDIFKKIQDNAQ
jgi:thioredoxin-related protein